ncbi:MAG TPA: cupin-like domain-containing protein [Vicinamibacteria bacterium]|nr:cupin-like domain-containing protein [Vicinamibacteria bacterium]
MRAPREVPRVGPLSRPEFEQRYLAPGLPVVVDGGAAAWPAWTADRLREMLAGRTVKVASSEQDVFGYDEAAAAYDVEELDFAQAADLITRARPSKRRYYLMQQSIPREFPDLAGQLSPPEFAGGARAHPHLWFGTEGNLTPLHYDMANNLFAQLQGRKRFTLFAPGESERLYPRPASSKHHNLSQVDAERPDEGRHPLLAEAQPWACQVGPGDLLFLPAFWWHQVRSLEMGVSVSTWWAPRPEQFLTPMARRMAPVLYERDRLLTFKAMVAEPGEFQGFLGMARFMESHGEPAMALLFAGAALEESLRLLYLRRVKPSDTAAPRDGRRMTDALEAAGALGAGEAADLRRWLDAVATAVRGQAASDAGAAVAGIAAFTAARAR